MTPVPVAAARNTNIVVEGEVVMTDEDLQKEIRQVTESIENLPEPDKSDSKEEKRHRDVLLVRKEVLERIKKAREKGDKNQELQETMTYGLLTSWGEKHPYLMGLVRSNIRWNAF